MGPRDVGRGPYAPYAVIYVLVCIYAMLIFRSNSDADQARDMSQDLLFLVIRALL
jgi:hypothetical protein